LRKAKRSNPRVGHGGHIIFGCIASNTDYVYFPMNDNDERLSDAQRDKLCDLMNHICKASSQLKTH
jgi:hypothetical protein